MKYCGWGILHNWDMSFGKFGGLPTVVAFPENVTCKAGTNKLFYVWAPTSSPNAPHHCMHNSTRHSVLKVITIGWSHLQLASNKPLKLCLICMGGLLLLVAIWQENQQQSLCKPTHEKKLATVTDHRELMVTKMLTASRDLGRDWAVT